MKNRLRKRLWSFALVLLLTLGGTLLWRAPDALAQLKTIVVAVAITPPFIVEDKRGALTGFDIDLINALATQAGLHVAYTKTDLRYLLPGVTTRLYDVGSACLAITPERQAQVQFTRPYFASGLSLIIPATMTTTNSVADLTPEMTVGVIEGSAAEAFVHTLNTALVHSIPAINDVFAKVEAGELNAAITSEANFLGYQMDHPKTGLKIVGSLLTYSECGLAVNQTDTALADQFNAALTELKSNGAYDKIYHKWFGERALPEKPVEPTPTAASPAASPTPPPATVAVSTSVTTTAALAGIYYLTVTDQPAAEQGGPAAARYQILTLAENGLWFVAETPAPAPADSAMHDTPTGQPGLWFVNGRGQVEAMMLNFTASTADAGAAEVIRKDYEMKVDSQGAVVGAYHTTHYAADLFALPTAPTATITQTIEFTGQRVQ